MADRMETKDVETLRKVSFGEIKNRMCLSEISTVNESCELSG